MPNTLTKSKATLFTTVSTVAGILVVVMAAELFLRYRDGAMRASERFRMSSA